MVDGVSGARRAAGRLAANSQLLDIRAVRFEAQMLNGALVAPYEVTVNISPSYELVPQEDGALLLMYSFAYNIDVASNDEPVAYIACSFNAAYGCDAEAEPTVAELEAFGDTTVALALYPYVRQFVHDTMARFNLSALVMPLYQEPMKVDKPGQPRSSGGAAMSREMAVPPRTRAKKKPTKTSTAAPQGSAKKAAPRPR